jgi:hypothetical protein
VASGQEIAFQPTLAEVLVRTAIAAARRMAK